MSSVSRLCLSLSLFALLGGLTAPWQVQAAFAPEGGEYPLADPFRIPGDQVHPSMSLGPSGGVIVWQDNATDGSGMGISARRLNQNLSRHLDIFRVNQVGAGEQENPQVAVLRNGGAVFVWQGGTNGKSRIYARFMGEDGGFIGGDVTVSSSTSGLQVEPSVACLNDGTVVVVWGSYGQDDAANPSLPLRGLQGVYGQRFSPEGEKLDGEFRVNQTLPYSQRNPVVTALADGGFLVVWISEKPLGASHNSNETGQNPEGAAGGLNRYSAEVFARRYQSTGEANGNEFLVSMAGQRCGTPDVAARPGGGSIVTWCQYVGDQEFDGQIYKSGWEIFVRSLASDGTPVTPALRVNTFTYGDQLYPKVAGIGDRYLVVWTSLSQDGFREGVIGRFVNGAGEFQENEFQVNTEFVGPQIYPTVADDGEKRILAGWSSFVGGVESFDVFAQRYSLTQLLGAPAPPFVSALSQSRLSVSWAQMDGYDVAEYHLYQDGSEEPMVLTTNTTTISGLAPSTEYSFTLAYKLTDGQISPRSAAGSVSTWSEDGNFDGLPDDWQSIHWGETPAEWPSVHDDSDGDGASNLKEFLAGTDPLDSASVLRARIESQGAGWILHWNAVPGCLYQVQMTTNLGVWKNHGNLRLAVEASDSIPVNGDSELQAYRVVRVR